MKHGYVWYTSIKAVADERLNSYAKKKKPLCHCWNVQQQEKAAASYTKAAFEVERQEKWYIIFYKALYEGSLYTH